MDLSIVIVSWNTRELLRGCLASVDEAAADRAFEVFVVDNASTDGSDRMVEREFPRARLIRNPDNRGFACANNQAIRLSRGRYVLLLNSDTVVRRGALTTMLGFADRHPEVGIVGPRLLNPDDSLQPSWNAFPTVWSELLGLNVRHSRPYSDTEVASVRAVDCVGGACFLIRRETVDQIGLLDEGYFMYSEEIDWCFRAKAAGWVVCYQAGAEVVHLGGQSSRIDAVRMKGELYRSKLRFFRKHYGIPSTVVLGTLLMARFLGIGMIGAGMSQFRRLGRPANDRRFREALQLMRVLARDLWMPSSSFARPEASAARVIGR